jgi:3-dehydroquinate dehydratase
MSVRNQMERMGWSLVVDEDTLEPCWVKAARCGNIVAYHPFENSATWERDMERARKAEADGAEYRRVVATL